MFEPLELNVGMTRMKLLPSLGGGVAELSFASAIAVVVGRHLEVDGMQMYCEGTGQGNSYRIRGSLCYLQLLIQQSFPSRPHAHSNRIVFAKVEASRNA